MFVSEVKKAASEIDRLAQLRAIISKLESDINRLQSDMVDYRMEENRLVGELTGAGVLDADSVLGVIGTPRGYPAFAPSPDPSTPIPGV